MLPLRQTRTGAVRSVGAAMCGLCADHHGHGMVTTGTRNRQQQVPVR